MKQFQPIRLAPGKFGPLVVVQGILAFLLCLGIGSSQTTGQQIFEKRCGGCHAVDRDKEGPNLAGVYGRAAGSIASFQYSPALQKSKLTWTSETLDKWLTDPDKLVPNNDMSFSVANSDERSAIIAYLKGISKK
jgi:cytochrome c